MLSYSKLELLYIESPLFKLLQDFFSPDCTILDKELVDMKFSSRIQDLVPGENPGDSVNIP